MTSVLLSIKPKYCELIASGRKTVEVRKTRPKTDVPFKCYIYCTKNGNDYNPNQNFWKMDSAGFNWLCNGRIIGEFICNSYLYLGNISTDNWERLIGSKHEFHKRLVLQEACLTEEDLHKYADGKFCYGWNISKLQIYDKPKELNEFLSSSSRLSFSDTDDGFPWKWSGMKHPPQSWCYVEEAQQG